MCYSVKKKINHHFRFFKKYICLPLDKNRKCVRHAAIAQTTEDLVASVTRSMLRELCQDVINKAIFAKTSSIYDALEHEVVSDVVRRDVEIIHKQKLFQAIAVSFGDAVMYETCRELVEVSINEMQRIARENAMEEVASGIFADVESAIIMDVCTNAWEDAQPKNSFHMLSLPEKRIRKKPHH